MLLAESRFTDVKALDRLYRGRPRRRPRYWPTFLRSSATATKAEGVYRARFCDLFPLLCVTKPYSHSYVQQILARSHSFPWFYPESGSRRATGTSTIPM